MNIGITEISSELARRIILKAQGLDGTSDDNVPNPLRIIQQLGYVQIDTINVIKRSHHHTFWSRYPQYTEDDIHSMQQDERSIYEYWGHAMSYLPMSDFRYSLPRMENFKNPSTPWAVMQLRKCHSLMEPILQRIRTEGPLSAKDFKSEKKKGGTWWDWKPAKVALEFLFWRGDLMISERQNFQKVYDLRERVLPDHVDMTMPSPKESGHFLVRRALQAMGVATESDIQKFLQPATARDNDWQLVSRDIIRQSIEEMCEDGIIQTIQILEVSPANHYLLSVGLDCINLPEIEPDKIFLLSPFDNLIIQRDRVKRLFEFDYALECYVPEPKRKYGYFVLPILWGENIVGRLDPKADRKTKTMIIKSLSVESPIEQMDDFLPKLSEALVAFTRFNQCEKIILEKVKPDKIKKIVKGHINKIT